MGDQSLQVAFLPLRRERRTRKNITHWPFMKIRFFLNVRICIVGY